MKKIPKPVAMATYNPEKIEKKWQKKWASSKIYKSTEDITSTKNTKPKYYILDMFPYPSGEGLHVGHPKGYIATDIVSRMKRMQGHSVLHPMGFDAFGLPAENYAIQTKTNPEVSVKKNVARFKDQLQLIGLDYDWSREINTTDPEYYRWTQWIFLQMFKKGLAYESFEPINWCPSCKTGLANEDVEDGRCERCGTLVEKKPMRQWVLKITDYAERLLADLDAYNTKSLPHIIDKKNPPKPGKKVVERRTIHALVRDPKTGKFLGLKWHKHPWTTFIVGGVDYGEDIIEAARREVAEETGYTDLKFVRVLGDPVCAEYFAAHKDQNRVAITSGVLFELNSDKKIETSKETHEDFENVWLDKDKDMNWDVMTCAELAIWLERLADEKKCELSLDLNLLDWPASIVKSQKDWIGKSEGALISFALDNSAGKITAKKIEVFTTRPDTLFGVTYVVLAPEHKLVAEFLVQKGLISNSKEVEAYISRAKNETEIERTDATKEKTGVELKGVAVINPANGEKVPVWISDYVLADYGTGAVMAVPAHDDRDFAFAKKFKLAIKEVIAGGDIANSAYTDSGLLINSRHFNGKSSEAIKKDITSFVGGKWVTKYKLRDWVFSRQRYWGEPIPVVHCEKCGVVAIPEKSLPVKLPKVKSYEPTGTGESPLAAIEKWVNVKCPQCGGKAKRETNTMPQWAGSSWYYLRYMDSKNSRALVDAKKEKYWSPVDFYVGGAEHATRHLIYARFWHKFLYDIGVVSSIEPFLRLQHVGLIMGEDGRKMSKRFNNVVNPDDVVKIYGADTLRIYEMFMGPFDQQISWNTDSMIGSRRFIERVWKLADKVDSASNAEKIIHKTIKKISDDISTIRFNTAISTLMIAVNELEKTGLNREQFEILLKLLAPFAPHVTEELWSNLGNKGSIHTTSWPEYKPELAVETNMTIAVQVNGKMRATFEIAAKSSDEELKAGALALPEIQKWIDGKEIKKVIIIKGRLISIVI
ncbi:MAG: leucine--tRNA ligase [Candidatus Taylorbacteria bacterium]